MAKIESVEQYLAQASRWQLELLRLRQILQNCDLAETIKWGAPCYTSQGKNVVGMAAFKNYFGLWFHQGALLSDPKGVLLNAQSGKTQAQRQWRFTSSREIKAKLIKAYVNEAIGLVSAGQEIKPRRGRPVDVPSELQQALSAEPLLAKAYADMTPGRQREYAEYVSEAKRTATRATRLAKIIPMIVAGQGLNDKYRS